MAKETRKFLASIMRKNDAPEFGFGATANNSRHRLLNKDGSANIVRIGDKPFNIINIYHALVTMSWPKFMLLTTLFYTFVNLCFALVYYFCDPEHLIGMIYHSEWERFMEIFFFSAQSLTTVGYGRLNPTGTFDSSVAALESFVGLLGFALATGLLYGRFSRPTARLLYSKNMVVAPYKHPTKSKDAPTALIFRIANARKNQLVEVEAQLSMSYNEQVDTKIQRRYQRLELELDKIISLPLGWSIVHPINPDSPLFALTAEDLESVDAEFLVTIKAIDDTYVQQVFSRSSYKWNEVVWNASFVSIISQVEDGRTALDLTKIDAYTHVV